MEPSRGSRYSEAKRLLARVFARLRYEVEGLENVPSGGPGILIMNHTGWEEILITILAVPRAIRIVGMHDLVHLDNPMSQARLFDTGYARGLGPVRRKLITWLGSRFGGNLRRLAFEVGYIPARVFSPTWRPVLGSNGMRAVVQALEAGEMVLLFPEGGYRRDGVMTPFKPGLGLLVRLLQQRGMRVPVIPAAQRAARCMTPALTNRFVPRLVIGSPVVMYSDGASPRAFDAGVARSLQDHVNVLLQRAWPGAPVQMYATGSSLLSSPLV